MTNNGMTPYSMIVHAAFVNDHTEIFVCLQKMPNNVMTSHGMIVRTALRNDPSEIFLCLQNDA